MTHSEIIEDFTKADVILLTALQSDVGGAVSEGTLLIPTDEGTWTFISMLPLNVILHGPKGEAYFIDDPLTFDKWLDFWAAQVHITRKQDISEVRDA